MTIPKIYKENSILIADDEPEHLEWLVDFMSGQGFVVDVVTDVLEAVKAVELSRYRLYIVDLNIPLRGWPSAFPASSTYDEYPGLHIGRVVRSQGNDGSRVIVYSAHFNDQITAEIKKLYCEYVVKGRPRELKGKVEEVLKKPDATALDLARQKRKDLSKSQNPSVANVKMKSTSSRNLNRLSGGKH